MVDIAHLETSKVWRLKSAVTEELYEIAEGLEEGAEINLGCILSAVEASAIFMGLERLIGISRERSQEFLALAGKESSIGPTAYYKEHYGYRNHGGTLITWCLERHEEYPPINVTLYPFEGWILLGCGKDRASSE